MEREEAWGAEGGGAWKGASEEEEETLHTRVMTQGTDKVAIEDSVGWKKIPLMRAGLVADMMAKENMVVVL